MSEKIIEDDDSNDNDDYYDINDDDDDKIENEQKTQKQLKSLRKEAEDYREKLSKRGVIYISRIPPFMKPNKMRTIFEEYGEVTRIYLAEEDKAIRKKRKENGGNASKQFSEGWIEYADKKIAKSVALSLNNTSIGGKKSSFYHDDIWNLKYLKGFQWDFLTERVAYERRIKEQKLKHLMLQEKKINSEIIQSIEQSHIQKHIEERKKRKYNNEYNLQRKNEKNVKQKQVIDTTYGSNQNKANERIINNVFTSKHED